MLLLFKVITVISVCTARIQPDNFVDEWDRFLIDFNPHYKNFAEFEQRREIFRANLQEMNRHNAKYDLGLHTYRQKVNQFSDRTKSELQNSLPQLKTVEISDLDVPTKKILDIVGDSETLPNSIDWRDRGLVTPVRDQGTCGASWAFAAIGAIEGQYYLATNKSVPLSAQQLVDCSQQNSGCKGGSIKEAFHHVKKIGGIASKESYPYKGHLNHCHLQTKMVVANVKKYHKIKHNSEKDLQRAVALHGPIAVVFYASPNFHAYKEGIFNDLSCPRKTKDLNHCGLVVGYGSEKGNDYWIVKNSWGTRWGENGYIRMIRNKNNTCHIAAYPSYPIVNPIS